MLIDPSLPSGPPPEGSSLSFRSFHLARLLSATLEGCNRFNRDRPGAFCIRGQVLGKTMGSVRRPQRRRPFVQSALITQRTCFFLSLMLKKNVFLLSFTDGNYFEGGQHQIGKPRSKSCGKRNDLEAIKKTCLQIKKEREKCSIVDVTDKS